MLIDLKGQRFGRLTVITRIKNIHGNTAWRCLCDCGNEKVATTSTLKGGAKSCGCIAKERHKAHRDLMEKTRGQLNKRIYGIWQKMIHRTTKPNDPDYKIYGGRGIKVCDEWLNDYLAFEKWSLSHGHDNSLTIDRIDNDGNYSPENCRWADKFTQNNNRSISHRISYKNKTMTVTQWSREFNLIDSAVSFRVSQGWSMEDIEKYAKENAKRLEEKRNKNRIRRENEDKAFHAYMAAEEAKW